MVHTGTELDKNWTIRNLFLTPVLNNYLRVLLGGRFACVVRMCCACPHMTDCKKRSCHCVHTYRRCGSELQCRQA